MAFYLQSQHIHITKYMIYLIVICFVLGLVAILFSVQLRRRRTGFTRSALQPHRMRGSVGAQTPDLWITCILL